jgi:hypothetical protein
MILKLCYPHWYPFHMVAMLGCITIWCFITSIAREANCFNLFGRWEWHIPQKLITLYGAITQRIITRLYSSIKTLYPIHQSPWNLYPEFCIVFLYCIFLLFILKTVFHCCIWQVHPNAGGRVGTRWRSWLRHCATSRKVTGSIPSGVNEILHWHNFSGKTMALGLTQPLTEISTRNIFWGVKAAGVYGWQPYHLYMPIVLKSGSLKFLEPSGPVQACNGIVLTIYFGFG